VPLVLAPDGTRLAKRHGSVTLADRAARGESATDVAAQLLRSVGLPGDLQAAREAFDPAALPSHPTVLSDNELQ
jgi:glutamyl-tRNA synthetase